MNSILYCFVSHQPAILHDHKIIAERMKKLNYHNYIVVYGGQKIENIKNNNVVHVDADDDYCSLPVKLYKVYQFINNNKSFNYVVKFDRSIILKKLFNESLFKNDYSGLIQHYGNIQWHFNKCPKSSKWFNRDFVLESIDYCMGLGYVLSKNAINIISQDDTIYKNHVYEDVYVGDILRKNNIKPSSFTFNIAEYFYDPYHSDYFKDSNDKNHYLDNWLWEK